MNPTPPFYLYCFTRADVPAPEADGVGGTGAPFLIAHGEVAVVASGGAQSRFPVSRRNLLGHQGVIEAVMEEAPVLPMRFGTVAESREQIERVLAGRHDELRASLETFEGRAEYAVRLRWMDENAILAEIGENDPQILEYKSELQRRGSATYQDRIKLGQLAEQALVLRNGAVAEQLREVCAELADRVEDAGGNDIANLALLMRPERYPEFLEALERYDAAHDGLLRIKVTGPLPPFSFSEMSLDWEGETNE